MQKQNQKSIQGDVSTKHSSGEHVESPQPPEQGLKPTERPWYVSETASNKRGVFSQAKPTAIAIVDSFPLGKNREDEANAELIVHCVNLFPTMIAAFEKINMLACYASEENTDAKEAALLDIGTTARSALALATKPDTSA